jgi:hypothetical protein
VSTWVGMPAKCQRTKKCFVGSKVLPEIVQGCFQLWRTISQQDQLALLRKPNHPPDIRGRAPRQQRGAIVTTRHKKARSKLGGQPKHCSPSELHLRCRTFVSSPNRVMPQAHLPSCCLDSKSPIGMVCSEDVFIGHLLRCGLCTRPAKLSSCHRLSCWRERRRALKRIKFPTASSWRLMLSAANPAAWQRHFDHRPHPLSDRECEGCASAPHPPAS